MPHTPYPNIPQRLKGIIQQAGRPLWILMHDYPDPDCLASAMAMQALVRHWDRDAMIVYGGGMGRPANKAMVGLLDLAIHRIGQEELAPPAGVILVDTQPGVGNNSLPAYAPVLFVVDHHPARDAEGDDPGYERDIDTMFGSTSTMMYRYLLQAGVDVTEPLATALALGILTDTDGLARDATDREIDAYASLLPLVDLDIIRKVMRPVLNDAYFAMLARALHRSVRYGEATVADVGEVPEPDWLSEISEMLLRAKGCAWSLALGRYNGRVYLSLRIAPPRKNAAAIIRNTVGDHGVGGGHSMAAGGMILPGPDGVGAAALAAVERFLAYVGVAGEHPRSLYPQELDSISE